jgi:hypothetical protein
MEDLQAFATKAARVSESDQVLAAVAGMAEQVATYRAQLIKSGVPKALANELTLQAAAFVWGAGACCHGDED